MSSLQPEHDTPRKWIDLDTGKLKFSRFHEYNLEERTVAGADLFRIRYYKTMTEASKAITQGHHIEGRAFVQHANAIFAARGDCQPDKQASQRWARRFIKRNAHIFKRTATHSRDAKRKAGANRSSEEECSTPSNAQEGRADAVNPQNPPSTRETVRNDWRNGADG
ncbi:hypothetical protein E4U56_005637 [Claviceps arundinis]|uniref:HTH CENPB-type domain-containing protein n=1 Tax=Claviceps arundinis TaxID=1623583 RepID=A0A9P7MLT3_9HYPO|nr:hypothetical protein E4U56_005637 [Claviceps arundinis]